MKTNEEIEKEFDEIWEKITKEDFTIEQGDDRDSILTIKSFISHLRQEDDKARLEEILEEINKLPFVSHAISATELGKFIKTSDLQAYIKSKMK